MIDFSNSKLGKLIVHKVGNKTNEEGLFFSNEPLKLYGDTIEDLLLKFFLSAFKNDNLFRFYHQNDLNLNETYLYSSKIFDDNNEFFEQSKNLAAYLYECSTHPKIKKGEFYTVIIKNCIINNETTDAIGLFKTENKDTYLQVKEKDENFEIKYEKGININKLDKACLIFNAEKDNGYIVSMVDNINKSGEAQYWRDEFLKIKPREDNFFFTQNYLNVCKEFADKALDNIDKSEKIELKNNTMDYFNNNETFSIESFEDEVIKEEEKKQAFSEFVQQYEEENDIVLSEEFDISDNAVKKAKRKYKSVIKLDKNFHVYVHGKQELMEKGYDNSKDLNYYKLYFDKEN